MIEIGTNLMEAIGYIAGAVGAIGIVWALTR